MYVFIYYFWSLFILRESMSGEGPEREGDRESQAGSSHLAHRAWHRTRTHETLGPWPEQKSGVGCLTDWAT